MLATATRHEVSWLIVVRQKLARFKNFVTYFGECTSSNDLIAARGAFEHQSSFWSNAAYNCSQSEETLPAFGVNVGVW